jgi:hypothetical protein
MLRYSHTFLLQGSNVKGERKWLRRGWYVSKNEVEKDTDFSDIQIRKATGLKCFSITVW